jgi:hypothetical protein
MQKIEKAQELIASIVASPLVAGYNIGITSNVKSRRISYRSVGFEHFAIIEFNLSATQALKFEKSLYEILLANKKLAIFRKYRSNAKETAHKPSLGGKKIDEDLKYEVYIAWWTKGSPGYGYWETET